MTSGCSAPTTRPTSSAVRSAGSSAMRHGLPTGHMAEAEARVTAFGWLGKCLFMSQGGEEDDDTHRKHETTDMRVWTFACPHCRTRQPWKWEQVEWSKGARDEDGQWDFQKVRDSTAMRCASCNHYFEDTDRTRRELNATGRYVVTNPNAPRENAGFHWNALCAMSWGGWPSSTCGPRRRRGGGGRDAHPAVLPEAAGAGVARVPRGLQAGDRAGGYLRGETGTARRGWTPAAASCRPGNPACARCGSSLWTASSTTCAGGARVAETGRAASSGTSACSRSPTWRRCRSASASPRTWCSSTPATPPTTCTGSAPRTGGPP
jgi:hypothetical protein